MNDLFEVKQHDHCLRDGTRLLQPKVRTTTHGLRTISYLGAKLWNDLPVHMKNIHHMDPYEFKSVLLLREGPDLFSTSNVICDMLNRDQISLIGRGEEYIHIHICFYYFYVNLYEYDVYILWCFICCMHPFWFVPGRARYPALVGCKARFGADLDNTTFFQYIFFLYLYILQFVWYCTIYLSHTSPWLNLLVISCDNK